MLSLRFLLARLPDMPRTEFPTSIIGILTFLVVLVLSALAQAQTFTPLYTFTNSSDGGAPTAGVIQDQAGNLYGTATFGGDQNCSPPIGCGVVYEVTAAGAETVLQSFSGSDGNGPRTPVFRDKAGNIYGTTQDGGSAYYGTVFKIDVRGNETVLHNFTGGSDGCWPLQGLIVDKSGAVFGTATRCGSNYGTIFKVDRAGNFTVLHSFAMSDGAYPQYGHLSMDKSDNLYGVTSEGGTNDYGVLYKLSQSGALTVLHSFKGGLDGCYPYGSVVRDKAGNLYGTTSACGSRKSGTIWKVSKEGKETILHNFAGGTSDGCNPEAGVVRDAKGNLYGVTTGCGANGYTAGTLYKLRARGKLTLLHSFEWWPDGVVPFGEVLRTTKGTIFGTTSVGGGYGYGTVWSYVP
jgi:uncharacterized repeat protein (TIGR03803 family)